MGRDLDNSDFLRRIYPRDCEPSMTDDLSIRWIETVVTHELLRRFAFSIRPMCQSAGQERYCLGSINQGAEQFAND